MNSVKKVLLIFSVLSQTVILGQINVYIKGQIFNTEEKSIQLSQFQGNGNYVDFATTDFDDQGNFSLTHQLPEKDFYVLKVGQQHINLAITENDSIQVYGDGRNLLYYTNIIGNDPSAAMMEFFREFNSFNALRDSIQQVAQQQPAKANELDQFFRPKLASFQNYRKNFIAQNQNSPALIAPLQSVDPVNEFELYQNLMKTVINSLEGSKTAESLKVNLKQAEERYNASQFLGPGQSVPDIEMEDVNGKTIKLSDLKGKVVLLDFWASWCGPCRRENPNVVALYEKYKEAGFTVFSVSLDKSREPWLKAIESDKLTWPYHVSDLKGWGSEPAKMYKVSSIPFTILLDKDGKVIQKNLRGQQLEVALSSIFGF